MKLRCVQNSIRIRVRKSELEQLLKAGKVEESVTFGSQNIFKFSLSTDIEIEAVEAVFYGNTIHVVLPLDIAKKWIATNQVGIEVNNVVDEANSLHILIEKDFPCLDREEENKADTFWELAKDKPEVC